MSSAEVSVRPTASASGDSADLLTGVSDPPPSPTEESSPGKQASATGCLQYESETALLRGVVERATFPGPPNYQSIAKGEAKETYWLLRLEHPRWVEAAGNFLTLHTRASAGCSSSSTSTISHTKSIATWSAAKSR